MIVHEMRDLVSQRLYAPLCGYEVLNDHAALRNAPLMQSAYRVWRQVDVSQQPLEASPVYVGQWLRTLHCWHSTYYVSIRLRRDLQATLTLQACHAREIIKEGFT